MRDQRSDALPHVAFGPLQVVLEFLPATEFRNRTKNTDGLSVIDFILNAERHLILQILERLGFVSQILPVQLRLVLVLFVQVAETAWVPTAGITGSTLGAVLTHGAVTLTAILLSHEVLMISILILFDLLS